MSGGKHYVQSVSGGIASAASAILGHKLGLSQSLVFADTTIEDPDLYRFVNELADALGQPLITLRDGRDPWDVFVANKIMANNRFAPCSRVLKTDQVKLWMGQNSGAGDTLVLGMFRDEEDRLERAAKNWAPRPVVSLLIDHKITPGAARSMVEGLGIELPALYRLGFPHNNCGGMCVRAGQGQFATLLAQKPAFYAEQEARNEWAEAEIQKVASVAASKGFIRVTRQKQTQYLSMREFREQVEGGTLKPKMYEMGGCGCFVDDLFSGLSA